jgi:hypothetical protein
LFTNIEQIDEQGISGERGKALVRGIAIAGWIQRQYLPDFLSRLTQEIDKLMRCSSEIANAVGAG